MGGTGGGGAEVLGSFGQELAGDLELAAVGVLTSLGLRSGGLEDDDLLGDLVVEQSLREEGHHHDTVVS